MKKYIYGALIGIVIALLIINIAAITDGAPSLTYVFSNSMEPTINTYDVFLVLPADKVTIGDIILFRSVKLDKPLITHRIIAERTNGYITKGDNSPSDDQSVGEPPVTMERIIGRVLTINGQPLLIHGVGKYLEEFQLASGKYGKFLSAGLIALGIIFALGDTIFPKRKRQGLYRFRLKTLYRIIAILFIGSIVIGILLGSRINTIKYLVSQNPGNVVNHIKVKEPGHITVSYTNKSLMPVWHFSNAINPIAISSAPILIMPMETANIELTIKPHQETGWYSGYVKLYNYPTILPYDTINFLQQRSPLLALFAIGLALYFWIYIIFRISGALRNIDAHLPLKAFNGNNFSRKLHHIIRKFFRIRRSRNKI